MTRSVTVALLAFAFAPACIDPHTGSDGDPMGGGPGGGPQPECDSRGLCPSEDMPVVFGRAPRFGVGMELAIDVNVHSSIAGDVEFVGSDDSIDAAFATNVVKVHATRAGSSKLVARRASTHAAIAMTSLTAIDVATIGFTWRTGPISEQPVTKLAALKGSRDNVGVAFRAADGELLGGTGTIEIASLAMFHQDTGSTLSEVLEPRQRFGLNFFALGSGTVTAKLRDGRSATLAIEVVDAPATIEIAAIVLRDGALAPAPDPVIVRESVGADILGKTADGRFVAGVSAAWTTSVPVNVLFGSGTSDEIVFGIDHAGSVDLTANVGGKLAIKRITAQ